jgi:hypothetical protein
MIRRTMLALIIAAAVSAAPAWAGNWNGDQSSAPSAPAAGSGLKSWNINVKMIENSGSSSGPCTGVGVGFADFCAVGPCFCYTYTGTANGATGKGTAIFYETFDSGTIYDFSNYGCASAYGEIDILGKKDEEAIAFVGSDCGGLAPSFLSGACLLGLSSIYSGGQGQCSGLYSQTTATTFKIKGKAPK